MLNQFIRIQIRNTGLAILGCPINGLVGNFGAFLVKYRQFHRDFGLTPPGDRTLIGAGDRRGRMERWYRQHWLNQSYCLHPQQG